MTTIAYNTVLLAPQIKCFNKLFYSYKEILVELNELFVTKRSFILLKALTDEINFLIDLYINDKGILFQQMYIHMQQILAQELKLYKKMFSNMSADFW